MNFLPDNSILSLLAGATLAVKLVMLFLGCMSLWSWTIIIIKFFTIGAARKKVMAGYDAFVKAGDLSKGIKGLGDKEHS
ncbi:MAG TPA: protein TolQ, partial [Pseudodesulfovibrio sp.]|nr:protein TolQ [Pseudodesulfovibrio sp.]